jgi:hypothetical protein
MRDRRLPEWAMPITGMGVWSGLLRVLLYSVGPIVLVTSLGWWGVLAAPFLIPLVWLVEGAGLGISRVVRTLR